LTDDKFFKKEYDKETGAEETVSKEIKNRAKDKKLSCTAAFEIAKSLEIAPEKIGQTADILKISLSECRLGLFGYKPNKKIVKPQNTENSDLLDSIINLSRKKRLDCEAAWKIAKLFDMPKLTISNICEANEIKIRRCQLGAF